MVNIVDYLDPKYFVLELPLYGKIKIYDKDIWDFKELLSNRHAVDYYNPIEKAETTYELFFCEKLTLECIFSYHTPQIWNYKEYQVFDPDNINKISTRQLEFNISTILDQGGFFSMIARCRRTQQSFIFHYYIDVQRHAEKAKEWIIQKIGQYPSRADFELSQIKKYAKILGSDYNTEYTRAIGLYASGIGIGSFVYLRRIFESLIEDAHNKAKEEKSDWNEDEYRVKKMTEKINSLKDYLPSFLYENAVMYGILSKGVHELSEKECLDYFDTVRAGIDIILEQKYEEVERKRKEDEAQKKINELKSKIK